MSVGGERPNPARARALLTRSIRQDNGTELGQTQEEELCHSQEQPQEGFHFNDGHCCDSGPKICLSCLQS